MTPPTGRELRLAVIGCGAISTLQHLPALARQPGVVLSAVIDADLTRARETMRRFGALAALSSLDELTAPVDAVLVATPNQSHAPIALAALQRGFDVMVEKPMAMNASEAQHMVATASAHGRILAVGLEFRFVSANRAVRDILAAGWLGRLERYELRQGVVPRWPFASDYVLRRETAGGGVLFDYGAHLLDLLFYWLGEPAEARYRDDARGGLESNAEIEFIHAEGFHGFVETSRTRNLENRVRFHGERGTLEVDVWSVDPMVRLIASGSTSQLVGRAPSSLDFAATFDEQWRDFLDAVRNRRPAGASGEDGVKVQRWIERCYAVREPLAMPWERADLESGAVS